MSRSTATGRIAALDIARGVVMVLMALDHVRVYSGLPAGGPTPGIFFTRWITHYCAPAFFFLAGTGIWLLGQSLADRRALSRFLVTRGVWLVLLELTVLRLAWTFNFDYAHYLLAGVIWSLGWCMVLMAAIVWLPPRVILVGSLALIAGHNLTNLVHLEPAPAWFWQILYFGGPIELGSGGPTLAVLYSIVPWVGVMAAGYAFGPIMRMAPEARRRWCVALGFGAILLFVILRGLDGYGDPRPWHASQHTPMPALLRFLNASKYPASLDYLLMTLGPLLVAIPWLEHATGRVSRALATVGRVPLFFYVLHIPLIHATALLVSVVRTGAVDPWLFTNHPMFNPPAPDGYTWSLGLLYGVWVLVVLALWFPCQWYARLKATHRYPWMSYL